EDEMAFGSGDDTVHAREARNLRRDALSVEIEDHQGTVPEVRDVEAPIKVIDGLIIKTRRSAGKRHVRDMVERERAFRRERSRGEEHEHKAKHHVVKSRGGSACKGRR